MYNLFLIFLLGYPTEIEITKRLEKKYVNAEAYANQLVLWDRTRPDMMTATHVFEVEWAPNWYEAIGQSLYYGIQTEKKPAIILLVKDLDKELRYVYRCQLVCQKYDIKLYIERVDK